MTRHQSEGEVHVEAMRLILAEMERREDIPDWTIWQHMLNMLETIFQGIENQRDDDRDELMHTRKDRDHWQQARQDAIEAGELMKAEIETLRKELDDAKRAASDEFTERQVLTVEQQQDAAAWQQQLDAANAESAGLREQLDAANVTILAQKRGIQYLRLLIDKVRGIVGRDDAMSERLEQISQALDEFDHGTIEPTPCPECERLRKFVNLSRQILGPSMTNYDVGRLLDGLAELDAEGGA